MVHTPVTSEVPPVPPFPRAKNKLVPVLGSVLILLVYGAVAYLAIHFGTKRAAIPPVATVSPAPTPTPIILTVGKGEYAISQGKHVGPTVTRVIFDPLDAQNGQQLTITLRVTASKGVQTIIGVLRADHTYLPLIFHEVPERKGEWQTEIILTDTLWYRYILTVTATDSEGSSVIEVAPRS